MMATTTFRDLPNTEDKTLFLVMDGENNLTGDPATIDRMMERKETTEVRIIRLLASSAESEEIDDSDDEEVLPRVKLTVEEILPENGEDEIKTGDSTVPPDFVDPLSQLDNEQMLKLKKALASEQAKQLLGDNVTAMLDVLSVDDNPTMFLQNSIRRDHCYTPLSPSADPRGASFVLPDASIKKPKVLPKTDLVKPSGSGLGQQSKMNVTTPPSKNSDVENENDDDEDSDSSDDSDSDGRDRSSDSDYRDRNSSVSFRGRKRSGRGGPWGSRRMRGGIRGRKPLKIRGRVRKDPEEVTLEVTEEVQIQPTTPVETPSPATINVLKRGRPRKVDPSVTPKSVASANQANAPEPQVVIPIDHVAAKVYSADAIRLGRPQPKSEEERRRDMARIMHKLDASGQNGSRQIKLKKDLTSSENASKVVRPQFKVIAVTEKRAPLPKIDDQLSQMIETLEDGLEQETISVAKIMNKPIRTYVRKEESKVGKMNIESTSNKASGDGTPNIMGGKYPRRENRKLPSHFADSIGPELFSSQDIIRKRTTAPPAEENSLNKGKIIGKVVQKSLMRYVVKSSSPSSSAGVLGGSPEPGVSTQEVIQSVVPPTPEPTLTETVNSIETILEGFEIPDQPIEKETKKEDISKIETVSKVVVAASSDNEIKIKKDKIVLGKDVSVRRRSSTKHEKVTENEPKKTSSDRKGSTSDNILIETPDKSEAFLKDEITKKKIAIENKSIRKMSGEIASSSEKVAAKIVVENAQKVIKTENRAEEIPTTTAIQPDENSPGSEDRKRNAVKRRRSDEVSDIDSDIDDTLSEASWNSEDDPERLWCICQKPHNNRFMICCDVCEDWFHGKCVGITKSIGKQMEQDGLEWSCPPCSKKKRAEEKEKESKGELKQSKLAGFAIKRTTDESTERKCIMCKGPVRENSIYCSDKCIRSHSQKAIAQFSSTNKISDKPESSTPASAKKEDHVIVMDPTRKKVLTGTSAPTLNNLTTWLKENPSYHVLYQKQPNKDSTLSNVKGEKKILQFHPAMKIVGERPGQAKLIVSPNSKHIKIVSRPVGPQPLNQKVAQANVKKNTVVNVKPENSSRLESKLKIVESPKHSDKKAFESPKPVQRRRKEKHNVLSDYKSPTHQSSKMDDGREEKRGVSLAGEQVIRDSVRKTLGEALKARKADCKDLESKEIDIESLATKIEDRLYKHFDNKVDVKYKSKYRSLVFNIKDVKNQTLYRKILENSISPKELVRLTADEMASQELAQWREKENQHQLEMIKKTELELMSLGQTFIIKSHKGEEVIEKDPKVAAVAAALDPNTSAKELVSAINSVTSTTPDPVGADEKTKGPETSLMKMNKKEKERRREKEKRHKRDRSRSKGSKHSKSRRRSRSRSKDRRRSSRTSKSRHSRDSREKDKHKEKEKDKVDQEKVETVEKELVEISTSAPVESPVKYPVSDEGDYEPTSTVSIKTPEAFPEEQEDANELASVWAGKITMPEVAKFHGIALEVHGDCSTVDVDVGDKLNVVGRIPYNAVWDYVIKMEKLATKDVVIMQILPLDIDVDKTSFSTLFHYLSKRSRTGVVSRISDQVKDFYLYPHELGSPLPEVINYINIPSTKDSDQILLGIMIKTNRSSSRSAALPLPPTAASTRLKLPLPKSPLEEPDLALTSPSSVDGSNTDPRKRKIRVQVEVSKTPSADDDDSPYSPASSDEDLPPLNKLPRKTTLSNPLTNADATSKSIGSEESFAAVAQIQKKIEEMNRAIEEETLQIQNLASSVKAPLNALAAPTIASTLNIASPASFVPNFDMAIKALKTIASSSESPLSVDKDNSSQIVEVIIEDSTSMELDIPLPPTPAPLVESGEKEVVSEADNYIAPAAPSILLPEVAQISIPSDLHEILANINKQSKQSVAKNCPSPPLSPKSPEPLPPGVEDLDASPMKQLPKVKPDRSTVFESDGVPAFAPFKKPIKFDLKLKDRELDERPSEVNNDIDERNSTPMSSLDQRIALALDQDERETRIPSMPFGDRDERSTRSSTLDSRPTAASSRDKDDRLSRHPTSDRDYRRSNRWRNDSFKRRGDRDRSGKWKDNLEDEWSGSIRRHEDEARRRNRSIRSKEIEMLKQEVDRESD